jgi:toxin-antitoxin system PIN domain toxin
VILPDVNVLLYALRSDARDHEKYRSWLHEIVNGDAAYGISPQVLGSLARIATHPRVFRNPSALEEVFAFSDALMGPAHCQIVLPGPRHWPIFRALCSGARARGNLVQDAWFAALAIESGCEWITADRDYGSFAGLRWRPPF